MYRYMYNCIYVRKLKLTRKQSYEKAKNLLNYLLQLFKTHTRSNDSSHHLLFTSLQNIHAPRFKRAPPISLYIYMYTSHQPFTIENSPAHSGLPRTCVSALQVVFVSYMYSEPLNNNTLARLLLHVTTCKQRLDDAHLLLDAKVDNTCPPIFKRRNLHCYIRYSYI